MTRQQPADVRRRRILDAATTLLIKRGLAATSMDSVAAAAGIAKGTVYLYFPSRADLLSSLRRRYAENLARRAGSILGSSDVLDTASLIAAYQRLAAELTTYLLANRRLHHVLYQEAGVSEEDTMQPLRELIRSSLRRATEQGALDPVDPDVLMRFLLDGLHGAVMPLFHERSADRGGTIAEIQELIRRVLIPRDSPGPTSGSRRRSSRRSALAS